MAYSHHETPLPEISLLSCVNPKVWFDLQLKHTLYQATDIVAQNLAQGFVDLSSLSLAAERVAKLRLDHEEVSNGFAGEVGF